MQGNTAGQSNTPKPLSRLGALENFIANSHDELREVTNAMRDMIDRLAGPEQTTEKAQLSEVQSISGSRIENIGRSLDGIQKQISRIREQLGRLESAVD